MIRFFARRDNDLAWNAGICSDPAPGHRAWGHRWVVSLWWSGSAGRDEPPLRCFECLCGVRRLRRIPAEFLAGRRG